MDVAEIVARCDDCDATASFFVGVPVLMRDMHEFSAALASVPGQAHCPRCKGTMRAPSMGRYRFTEPDLPSLDFGQDGSTGCLGEEIRSETHLQEMIGRPYAPLRLHEEQIAIGAVSWSVEPGWRISTRPVSSDPGQDVLRTGPDGDVFCAWASRGAVSRPVHSVLDIGAAQGAVVAAAEQSGLLAIGPLISRADDTQMAIRWAILDLRGRMLQHGLSLREAATELCELVSARLDMYADLEDELLDRDYSTDFSVPGVLHVHRGSLSEEIDLTWVADQPDPLIAVLTVLDPTGDRACGCVPVTTRGGLQCEHFLLPGEGTGDDPGFFTVQGCVIPGLTEPSGLVVIGARAGEIVRWPSAGLALWGEAIDGTEVARIAYRLSERCVVLAVSPLEEDELRTLELRARRHHQHDPSWEPVGQPPAGPFVSEVIPAVDALPSDRVTVRVYEL